MDAEFWHHRWENNEIGFHEADGNLLLTQGFETMNIPEGGRIFIPLCGKTRDIAWLLERGYRVAGAELSKTAIEQLFADLALTPTLSKEGKLVRYSAPDLDIFVGDIFNLSTSVLGPVDAIYDRAALVALPEKMRREYTAHLVGITAKAPQFLICFEYDQSAMEGPPFSISREEVHQHYDQTYRVQLHTSREFPGGLKGICPATEHAWILT